jgi:hypothetical protein
MRFQKPILINFYTMLTIKNKEIIKGTKFLVHWHEFTILEMEEIDEYIYKITLKYYEQTTYQNSISATHLITSQRRREVFKVLKLNRIKHHKHNHYILSDEMNKSVLVNLCEIKSFTNFICAIQKFIVDNF